MKTRRFFVAVDIFFIALSLMFIFDEDKRPSDFYWGFMFVLYSLFFIQDYNAMRGGDDKSQD